MKFIEVVLWVGGSILLTFFLGYTGLAELQRKNDVAAFRLQHVAAAPAIVEPAEQPKPTNFLPPRAESDATPSIDYDLQPPDKSLWSSGRIASFAASFKRNSRDVLGVFEIPRLDLEIPLYDGASDLHMDLGIARIEGTALPGEAGNMGVAGHRDGYFRVLKDIEFGDEMIVNSGDAVRRYRVEQLMIVEPSETGVLDDTEDTSLTLVTCYPFYFVGHAPQRFIVRAVLQEEKFLTGG